LKTVICVLVGIISLGLTACTKNGEDKLPAVGSSKAKMRDANNFKKPFHGDMETMTSAMPISLAVESLKKNHLELSSTKTIGEVFDAYKHASKKEWREAANRNGTYFIDYICWLDISPVSSVALKEGVVKRALDIKFTVQADGETFIGMMNRIDIKSDGMVYTTVVDPADIKKIVTAIYENREIPF